MAQEVPRGKDKQFDPKMISTSQTFKIDKTNYDEHRMSNITFRNKNPTTELAPVTAVQI